MLRNWSICNFYKHKCLWIFINSLCKHQPLKKDLLNIKLKMLILLREVIIRFRIFLRKVNNKFKIKNHMKVWEILHRSSLRLLIQFVNQWEMQKSKQIMTFQSIVKVLLANILINKMLNATKTIYLNMIPGIYQHFITKLNQIYPNITKNLNLCRVKNHNKCRVKIPCKHRAKFHKKCKVSVLFHKQFANKKINKTQV